MSHVSPGSVTFSDTLRFNLEICMAQYASFIVHSFMTILVQAYVDFLESLTLKKVLKRDIIMISGSWRRGRVMKSCVGSWHRGGLVPECVLFMRNPT